MSPESEISLLTPYVVMTEAESRNLIALAEGGAPSLQADNNPLMMPKKMSKNLEILLMLDETLELRA